MTSAFTKIDFQISHLHWREDLKPNDVATIRALVTATGYFTADEIAIAAELAEHRLQNGPNDYRFIIAEYNSEMIGFACFGPIPATQHRYDLYWIAVHPDWQGCGAGKLLLKFAEFAAKQQGAVRVYIDTSTRPQYDSSRKFYEHCGYKQIADLPDFYAENDGKAIYMRDLFNAAQTSLSDEEDAAA
jgi:ribosomal protein S18 acetylase RimI-like enzyme